MSDHIGALILLGIAIPIGGVLFAWWTMLWDWIIFGEGWREYNLFVEVNDE